ncbi:phage portal protein [Paenibacillus anaericanus]|uniref:Phage portal protein n=1 Tax=Paenibacillus anaericanus TaxID=170367 RepID=A0A3S1K8R9_9BACL|nr:phage tail tube protein [Paenibacillus anaericanus]RUT46434.1 phage portal protein [Paenibacillus anaericanus]
MAQYLDPGRVIMGTFGQIFIEGIWQSNLNHLEANVEADKRELNLVGTEYTVFKLGRKKGTGTMSGYKVTSEMISRGFQKFNIIHKLEDPEAYGFERIQLNGCMVDKIQLANWTAGEEVVEETAFTFESYELLDPIVAS